MGVLKLSILDEQSKQYKVKMKIASREGISLPVGNCSCPCWAFIKKGEGKAIPSLVVFPYLSLWSQ